MRGYHSDKLASMIDNRAKLLSQLEVLNLEIAKLNREIGIELVNTFGNKIVRFNPGNGVKWSTTDGRSGHGVPHDKRFRIVEIRSANTFLDIMYFMKVDIDDKQEIIVKQEDMHSFEIIENYEG